MNANTDPLSVLREAAESENPVMVKYRQEFGSIAGGSFSAENYIRKGAEVERILEAGRVQDEKIKAALMVLTNAAAVPGDFVPEGM